jgi:hypothetical protein
VRGSFLICNSGHFSSNYRSNKQVIADETRHFASFLLSKSDKDVLSYTYVAAFFLHHHHHQLDCLKRPLTDYLKSILTNRYANSNSQFIYMPRLPQVSLKTRVTFHHSRFLPSRHIWYWLVIGNRHTLRGTVPTVHCEDVWPLALQLEILWRMYIICACPILHVSSYSSVKMFASRGHIPVPFPRKTSQNRQLSPFHFFY